MKKTLLFLGLLSCVSGVYAMEQRAKTDEAVYTALLKKLLAQPVQRPKGSLSHSQRITVISDSEEWKHAKALAKLSWLNREKPRWIPIFLYQFANERPSLEIHYYRDEPPYGNDVPNAVKSPQGVEVEETIRCYMGEKTE